MMAAMNMPAMPQTSMMPGMMMPMMPSMMGSMMPGMMPMMPGMMMPGMMGSMMPGMMPMMPGMMMPNMMGMMPVVMCRATLEMGKDGMTCKVAPMEGTTLEMMRERCEAMTKMMAMGMPMTMTCGGITMMCTPAATK